MSQSEQPANKLKLAQALLFFSQTSPTLPHYNPDCQPVEGKNKLIPLVQPAHEDCLVSTEFPEPEHIAPPPPVDQVNPYLAAKEKYCVGNQKFNKAWLAEIPWNATMRHWICAGVLSVSGV